jgi:hypothetical protein
LNEVYIEGLPTTTAAVQGETRNLSLGVSVEAIEQFQVLTNNPPASYQGQGVENFVLKSGTNDFHGSAFEFFRNTVLDARGFFPPTTPLRSKMSSESTPAGLSRKTRFSSSDRMTAITTGNRRRRPFNRFRPPRRREETSALTRS